MSDYNPSPEARSLTHCKFRTSFGGSLFCQHTPYLEGYCEFHYRALQADEINEYGVLNERLSDQNRRREINFYGIKRDPVTYLDDRE